MPSSSSERTLARRALIEDIREDREKLAAPWSGGAGGVGSGTRRRRISGPDGCSTAHHLDGNGSDDRSCQENESRSRAGPPRSSEDQEPR